MLKVKGQTLLAVIGVFWIAAGSGVLSVGIPALITYGAQPALFAVLILAGTAVFLTFHFGMFSKMVRKHAARIQGYGKGSVSIGRFLDAKGYAIIAVMMGGGAALRLSGILPLWFFAFFYTGLGTALALAGLKTILVFVNAGCECAADHIEA